MLAASRSDVSAASLLYPMTSAKVSRICCRLSLQIVTIASGLQE